jgi:hypothetical protein
MPDLLVGLPIAVCDQLSELRRDYVLRQRVYPRWVRDGKMSAGDAETFQARLLAAIRTIERVAADER